MKINLKGLTGMLTSKKGLGFIFGSLLTILVNTGLLTFETPEQQAKASEGLVVLVGAYLIGQGIADHGKGKAQAEAEAPNGGGGE